MIQKNKYNRRKFIKHSGTIMFASLLNGHLLLSKASKDANSFELIKEIILLSSVEISSLVNFYNQTLGFKIIRQNDISCTFQTGRSLLTFIKTEVDAPFYHFAFNIPKNKIKVAEKWLKSKTAFIKPPSHLLDESYQSDNIVHFRHWNAHSLFFYDPAGNVVEFIARHTLFNKTEGIFTEDDVLCISEIGLVVDDVYSISEEVSKQTGLKQYKGGSENFKALGDENGLLLFFRKDTKSAFKKGKSRLVFDTQIAVNLKTESDSWQIPNYPYIIRNKASHK